MRNRSNCFSKGDGYRFVAALALALFAVACTSLGEQVMDSYIKEIGGEKALKNLNNRVSEGTMEMKAVGMKGKISIKQARPNKSLSTVSLPAIGEIVEATNGEICWETSMITGSRILTGKERDMNLLMSQFDDSDYRKHYKTYVCAAEESVNGEVCYRVILTPKAGNPLTILFSKTSKLPVKMEFVVPTQMGDITASAFASDYRKVDGVLMPFKMVQKTMGVEVVTTMTSIKHNVALPANTFDPPASVKALIPAASGAEKSEKK